MVKLGILNGRGVKNLKKIFKSLIAMSVLSFGVSFSSQASAVDTGQTFDLKENEVVKFYDPAIGAYITPLEVNGNEFQPTTQTEYYDTVGDTVEASSEPEISPTETIVEGETVNPPITKDGPQYEIETYFWAFDESSAITYLGDPIKVSASINCTASQCRVDKQWNATVSKSYSVSGSREIKAINAGASFTFQTATSDSSTYSFTIKKGQKGHIAFQPRKKKSTGKLIKYSSTRGPLSSQSAYGRSAIKLKSGEADGEYIFIYE